MQRNLKVLLVKPNELPEVVSIKNTLEAKQELVGGLIEYTYLDGCDDIAIVCNEEGLLMHLPFNRDIGHTVIAGDFYVVGDDPTLGEDRSLTDEQIEKYSKVFDRKSIERTNEKITNIMLNNLSNEYYY